MKTVIRIAPCPRPGDGVNRWTFNTALRLYRAGVPVDRIRKVLFEHTTRDLGEAQTEIERALERVPIWLHGTGGLRAVRRWPRLNVPLRDQILRSDGGVDDLESASPTSYSKAEEVLPRLFPDNPLIWVATSVHPERGGTFYVDQLPMAASSYQFIAPNPLLSRSVPSGGKSTRCLANTGPRRFLVIESDSGTVDEQAKIIRHLADESARLVLIVHSAGKSLHAWFDVQGQSENITRRFMDQAVSLGADPAMWVKCQAVRMPGGFRPSVGRQVVLFFDPQLLGGAE